MIHKKILTFILSIILIVSVLSYFLLNHFGIFKHQNTKINLKSKQNTNSDSCTREKPFNINKEFNNALDLITLRIKSAESLQNQNLSPSESKPKYFPSLDFRNCLDIFYSDRIPDLKKTSAWFDSENSNPNHLIIKINSDYKGESIDSLVMATLLTHELDHVDYFLGLRSLPKLTCVQQEANAFLSQYRFLSTLSSEEQTKLMNLIKTKYYYVHGTFYDLVIRSDLASLPCNELQKGNQFNQYEFNICFWDKMQSITEEYITSIPGYQENCKSN